MSKFDHRQWRRKPIQEWTERDELDFCRHLMEPVVELMAVRLRAVMREVAASSSQQAAKEGEV